MPFADIGPVTPERTQSIQLTIEARLGANEQGGDLWSYTAEYRRRVRLSNQQVAEHNGDATDVLTAAEQQQLKALLDKYIVASDAAIQR